jgi:hypothetical protein
MEGSVMWGKILELLLRKSVALIEKETAPRKRLARAFIELHRALTNCDKAYNAFTAAKYAEWKASKRLELVQRRIRRLETEEHRGAPGRALVAQQQLLGYDDLKVHPREDLEALHYKAEHWNRAIERLAIAINKLRVVLGVHDRELINSLELYHAGEAYSFELYASDASRVTEIFSISAGKTWVAGRGFGDSSFHPVLYSLEHFMRNQLKLTAEELLGP